MNKFKNRIIVDCLIIPGLLLALISAAGCNSGFGGNGGSPENGTVDIAGRITSLSSNNDQGLSVQSLSDGGPYSTMQLVRGAAGTVVESAGGKISVNGKETNGTNEEGIYFLQEVAVNKDRDLNVSFDLDGYAGYYARVEDAQPGENYSIFPVLARWSVNEDLTKGEHRVLPEQGSNSVEFREGSLEENVTAKIYFGNPSTRAGALACPGGFKGVENSSAINASASETLDLLSTGYLEISMRDDRGERIQELSEPANVTMRLPQRFQNGSILNPSSENPFKSGDEIPWWSFNSTAGIWVKEPSLNAEVKEKDDTLYFQAGADRPGYWFAGFPMNTSCLEVEVINKDEQGLADIGVYAEGLTYPGFTRAKTDDSGVARVPVKSSRDKKKEKVRLYASKGKVDFLYNATESEGDQTEFVYTSSGESTCRELQNPIEVDSRGTVKGGVHYENTGTAREFDLYSSLGVTATTNDQGKYSLDVPLGVEVLLFAPGMEKSLTTTREQKVQKLDIEIPNRDPEVRSFSRTPDGEVFSLSRVNLYINATDPDPGDELTCEWNATAGSVWPKQGKEVTWTAPDQDSGSADIKVAVKDDYNGKTVKSERIGWESYQEGSTKLRVGVFRDSGFEDPVTNATVVLYQEGDTSSINSTQRTDADGMVDFGDIGRERASISIIKKQDKNWKIETLLDIAVGDFEYNISPSINLQNMLEDKDAEYTVNASLNKLPAGKQQTRIHPLFASKSNQDLGKYTNIGVHENSIQDDGKISLLGDVRDGSDLIGYGFLLDKAVQDGKKYDIDIDREPSSMNWTAKSDPVQDIYIMGKRKGVTYSYLNNQNLDSPQDRGNINIPAEFPLQEWIVYAGNKRDTDTRLIFWDKYSDLPGNFQIQFPDYRIFELDYDLEEERASWYIEKGGTAMDVLKLSLDGAQVKWNLLKQPELYRSGIKLPALPEDMEEKIDINWENQRLNIYDFDFANGYLEFVRKYNNGADPFNSASEYFKGYRQEPL